MYGRSKIGEAPTFSVRPHTVRTKEPTRATIHAFINNYFNSELKRETQRHNLDLRREELGYADESTILQMLIDQVLLCTCD